MHFHFHCCINGYGKIKEIKSEIKSELMAAAFFWSNLPPGDKLLKIDIYDESKGGGKLIVLS